MEEEVTPIGEADGEGDSLRLGGENLHDRLVHDAGLGMEDGDFKNEHCSNLLKVIWFISLC